MVHLESLKNGSQIKKELHLCDPLTRTHPMSEKERDELFEQFYIPLLVEKPLRSEGHDVTSPNLLVVHDRVQVGADVAAFGDRVPPHDDVPATGGVKRCWDDTGVPLALHDDGVQVFQLDLIPTLLLISSNIFFCMLASCNT